MENNLEIENISNVVFEKINNADSVALICHDNPDPDSISSAFALQKYIKSIKKMAHIYYCGNISHPQNRALVNVLDIEMIHYNEINVSNENNNNINIDDLKIKCIKKSHDLIVFLDTSSYNGNGNMRKWNIIPDIIIDHHYSNGYDEDYDNIILFKTKCGSTCSLISYLFEKNNVFVSSSVGTGLFLGLMTDTDNLSTKNTIEFDQSASSYLLKYIDFTLYNRIMHYDLPIEILTLKNKMYSDHLFIQNNVIIAGVGYIKPEFRDLISVLATELSRTEGIQKIVVLGLIEEDNLNKTIVASARTSADTINTNTFIKRVFGEKYAGAKQGSGGACVPLDDFMCKFIEVNNDNKDIIFNMIFEYYKKIVLEEHTK